MAGCCGPVSGRLLSFVVDRPFADRPLLLSTGWSRFHLTDKGSGNRAALPPAPK
jgi:hypothetical protein